VSEIYFFDGESTKIRLLPGLTLPGKLTALPRPPSWKGREERGREGRKGKRGRGEEGRRGEGTGVERSDPKQKS